MRSFLRHFFGVLFPMLIMSPSMVLAEGTAELIPSGSSSSCISYVQGNDGAGKMGPSYHQAATEYIYVHISNPLTETIYYGFTRKLPTNKPIYYQILDPNGLVVCSGRVAQSSSDPGFIADNGIAAYAGPAQLGSLAGYTAIECQPEMAGDYAIRFNVNNASEPTPSETKYYIHPFDVTVARKSTMSPIKGRLFAYRWHLNTTGASKEACMNFYTWTPDSLVVMMDMNGIRPFGYTVSFNSFGVSQTGDIALDRKSSSSVTLSLPEYKVFLNEPDEDVYPTGTPGMVEYLDIDGCQIDSSFCITVHTTKVGEINVYIDLTGNGTYEEGTRDVYFPFSVTRIGEQCIPWDGIDGFGNPIGITESGTVTVQFLAGVVHYPVYDPENHPYGFNCAIIRPSSGFTPLMYYDNRDTRIGTYELDGCAALCNIWTGDKGDRVMVNTWINTITSEDSEPFSMSGLCPPIAVTDSTCSRPSIPINIEILLNDFDRDNELDPGSVTLFDQSHAPSQFLYREDGAYVSVFPSDGDLSTMSFSYSICDNTSLLDGGALCDTGIVVIEILDDCIGPVLLSRAYPALRVTHFQNRIRLFWSEVETAPAELWLERAYENGLFYPLYKWINGESVNELEDMEASLLAGRWRYRWRLGDQSPGAAVEVVVRKQTNRQEMLVLAREAGRPLVITLHAENPGEIVLVDLMGREVYTQAAQAGVQTLEIPAQIMAQQAGYWVVYWRSMGWQEAAKLRPVIGQ